MAVVKLWRCMIIGALLVCLALDQSKLADCNLKVSDAPIGGFFNAGQKKKLKDVESKLENSVLKSKVEMLGEALRKHVNSLKKSKKVELVFLVDASASVGEGNFASELKFVQKLLADFTVSVNDTRVSVITFASKGQVIRHVDHITFPSATNHKCVLLHHELPTIHYTGGGTYTLGAVLEAQSVLAHARPDAQQAVFLITDGFSNGGDPLPAAKQLKQSGVTVFTFGIRNGNTRELYEMASLPAEEHSYILDSFGEFAALVRRALHQDLKAGLYLPLPDAKPCDRLCANRTNCCDDLAMCSCGTDTGHYGCVCPPGYYGSGLAGTCKPCPTGTYSEGSVPGDLSLCLPCPDANHITPLTATRQSQCLCKKGFVARGDKCQVISCRKLSPPMNGYFVKSSCGNVLNAACGVRCNVGYRLSGSSIRLCQEDGTWSGEDAECVVKTCSPPPAPLNGDMNCSSADLVVDTECKFSCEQGHLLVGSRTRSCLPVSRWDGLKTICKPLHCPPIPKLSHGLITPGECTTTKQLYGTQCNISCLDGFALRGPRTRNCGGKAGTWSGHNSINKCVDVTPPILKCPSDITISNDLNEDYATVSWTVPNSTDNSGHAPSLRSEPSVLPPLKIKVGITIIKYTATDASKNKAHCNFTIKVEDQEPPEVDHCEAPPPFLSDTELTQLSWDPPLFHDNSGQTVKVTHVPDTDMFPYGDTEVLYVATDEWGNNSTCVFNVTVEENVCQEPSDPIHGHSNCTSHPDSLHCILTCQEGYAFAVQPRDFFCTYDETGSVLTPDKDVDPFPDCSVTVLPNTITQDSIITLDGEETLCQDPGFLSQLEAHMKAHIVKKLLEICGNGDLVCQVGDMKAACDQILSSLEEESNSVARRRRRQINNSQETSLNASADMATTDSATNFTEDSRNSTDVLVPTTESNTNNLTNTINVNFKLIAQVRDNIVGDPTKFLHSGMRRIKEGLDRATKNSLTGEVGPHRKKLRIRHYKALKDPHIVCQQGAVYKRNMCVKCPIGTAHNTTSGLCESCGFGRFQPLEGQTSCELCPPGTSTRRIHAKNIQECRPLCPPGCFGRKRRPTLEIPGLKPCTTCEVGSYQTLQGQTKCLRCPSNTTTRRRGAKGANDCKALCQPDTVSYTGLNPCLPCPEGYKQPLPGRRACYGSHNELLRVNECFSSPCLNDGLCQPLGRQYFICDCAPGFAGNLCEIVLDSCDSAPCLHGGSCLRDGLNYKCACSEGYTGASCEEEIDECLSNPCLNGGICIDSINEFICLCSEGFQGDTCEEDIDECAMSPCLNNASCVDGVANYTCECRVSFTGKHCEEEQLDLCSFQPCDNGGSCLSQLQNYSCDCAPGYTGGNCEVDIDDCALSPCSNDGRCEDLSAGFKCHCQPPFLGTNCETKLQTEVFLRFPSSSTTDYIILNGPNIKLNEVTVCLWLRSADKFNYGTIFSYATRLQDNSFTLTDYNGFVLYVNGQRVITDIVANDGWWHFVCVTWSSTNGEWGLYIDGRLGDQGSGLANGTHIPANGMLVLGQEQDHPGGGFSQAESFMGHMSSVAIWDYVVPSQQVVDLATLCPHNHKGTLLSWAHFLAGIRGNLQLENSTFCMSCPTPPVPLQGSVHVVEWAENKSSVAIYSCDDGFNLRWEGDDVAKLSRRCLKQGHWEGEEPTCHRVSCGFPGYFPRGFILGRSYLYWDIVRYRCRVGYIMVGTPSRVCRATGEWSGDAPRCQGKTCETPISPMNGLLRLLAADQELNSNTTITLQYGDEVEIECEAGHRLVGPNMLTCLRDGLWDSAMPVCQPSMCKPPPRIPNGHVLFGGHSNVIPRNNNFNNKTNLATTTELGLTDSSAGNSMTADFNLTFSGSNNNVLRDKARTRRYGKASLLFYDIGDTIHYNCDTGYLIHIQDSASSELTCVENGVWKGLVPDCLPVECPKLTKLDYGVIKLRNAHLNQRERTNSTDDFNKQATNSTLKGVVDASINFGYEENVDSLHNLTKYEKANKTILSHGHFLQNILNLSRNVDSVNNSSAENFDYDRSYIFGTEVEVSCDVGFQLMGAKFRVCLNTGVWSSTIPLCKPVTCEPDQIPFFKNASTGGSVTNITTNGTFHVPGNSFGDVAVFRCSSGYKLSEKLTNITAGNSTDEIVWRCGSNGTWEMWSVNDHNNWITNINHPLCEVKSSGCPIPKVPEQAYLATELPGSGGVVDLGANITLKCSIGYKLNGTAQWTCNGDGKWSDANTTCQPVQCRTPPSPTNSELVSESQWYHYGDMVSHKCLPGYQAYGDLTSRCQAHGRWSRIRGKCSRISCGKPVVSPGASVLGFSYLYQKQVVVSCPSGTKISEHPVLTCQSDGKWSGSPTCQPI